MKQTIKKIVNIIFTVVILLIFCIFALAAIEPIRNFLAILLLILGFISMRYRSKLGALIYSRQLNAIKSRSSEERFVNQFKQMGIRLLITGTLFILITILLRIKNV